MPDNSVSEAAALVRAAKTAAEEADKYFAAAKDVMNRAKTENVDELEDNPTLELKLKTAREIDRLAGRATGEAAEARRQAEKLKALVSAAAREESSIGNQLKEQMEEVEQAVEDADRAKTSARNLAKRASKEADAARVSEGLLNLENIVKEDLARNHIYPRLEECEKIAGDAGIHSDMIFISEGLPLINGIIQVGSAPQNRKKALDWIKERWGADADPKIVLSALVFIYVVDRGVAFYSKSSDRPKLAIWDQIEDRVQRMLY